MVAVTIYYVNIIIVVVFRDSVYNSAVTVDVVPSWCCGKQNDSGQLELIEGQTSRVKIGAEAVLQSSAQHVLRILSRDFFIVQY